MFNEVIRRGSQDYPGDAVARMYIIAENLSDPIIVRPRPLGEMTAEAVLEAVMAALNSNEGILVTDKFQIQLGIAQFERGSGLKKPIVNVEKDSKVKKSIVTINNRDHLCLAGAIAVCLFHWEVVNAESDAAKREARKAYNNMRKGDQNRRNSQQKKKALQYHALAGVPTDRPCCLADISKFEEALDVDMYVFAAHVNQRIVYPDYERPRREKRVYLFYSKHDEMEGHFDAITKVPGFLARGYFYHKCLKGFHSRDKHICEEFCRACRRTKGGVKLPSATIVTLNADLQTASTTIKSVKPSEKKRFLHPATSITNAKPVRPSYRPPRGARMITDAGSLNADPAMSTTLENTCAISGSGIRRTDRASMYSSISSVPRKAEFTCPTLW